MLTKGASQKMAERDIRPGDLALTTKLVLFVIDADLEKKGLAGRRLSDGLQVQVPREAVRAVYSSWTLAENA
jgi:hypothetical protein